MRFTTEFELQKNDWSGMKESNYKANCKLQLGVNIAEVFGWQNPVNGNINHHRLEIEAFPMDKWIEFKERLSYYLGPMSIGPKIFEIISELESFGKPAGDTITNTPIK